METVPVFPANEACGEITHGVDHAGDILAVEIRRRAFAATDRAFVRKRDHDHIGVVVGLARDDEWRGEFPAFMADLSLHPACPSTVMTYL